MISAKLNMRRHDALGVGWIVTDDIGCWADSDRVFAAPFFVNTKDDSFPVERAGVQSVRTSMTKYLRTIVVPDPWRRLVGALAMLEDNIEVQVIRIAMGYWSRQHGRDQYQAHTH